MRAVAWRTLVAGVAMVLGAASCSPDALPIGPPQACTMIGCSNGVTVPVNSVALDLAATYEIEVCVDGDCDRAEVGPDGDPTVGRGSVYVDVGRGSIRRELGGGPYDGEHEVSVRIVERGGDTLVDVAQRTPFERSQPNGPNCDPVCWVATLEV